MKNNIKCTCPPMPNLPETKCRPSSVFNISIVGVPRANYKEGRVKILANNEHKEVIDISLRDEPRTFECSEDGVSEVMIMTRQVEVFKEPTVLSYNKKQNRMNARKMAKFHNRK
jgi:hypothetical protein